jgi:hypothetical protein
MSLPASVSPEYIKMINKEGLYFNEGSAVKRDCQNGSFDVVAICLDKQSAQDVVMALNFYDDNYSRWEAE